LDYKLITERFHLFAPNINICFAVEFNKTFSDELIHEAIKTVHTIHPILRSSVRFDQEGNSFYHIEEQVKADFTVIEISDEDEWLSIIAKEQKQEFILSRAPLIRFKLLKCNEKMFLIMCVHHILADGLSCVKILKSIVSCMNEPGQNIEQQQPNLLEDSVLYDNEKLSSGVKLLVNMLNKKWGRSPHVFNEAGYYRMRENYWKEQSHSIEAMELNEGEVLQLKAKCKENGVTINTILITSLLKAAQVIEPRNIKAGIAVSIRPKENSIGNFASGISIIHKYRDNKSMWENASKIQSIVSKRLNNEKNRCFYLSFLKALNVNLLDSIHFKLFDNYKNKTTDFLAKSLGYTNEPIGCGISNLGMTDLTSELGVKRVFFAPPLVANSDKIAGAISTDTGLRIFYQYSNQINKEMNKKIYDKWIEELKKILNWTEIEIL